MRRREFITGAAGAVAWPMAARAQQGERKRRIGVLMNYPESDHAGQARVAAFREQLQRLGWTNGRNIQIDYRWSEGDAERLRAGAGAVELVAMTPDVIASGSATLAVKNATTTIPVVAVSGNLVFGGMVESFARPGGNITGLAINTGAENAEKWLDILHETMPSASRIAYLWADGGNYYPRMTAAASHVGATILPYRVRRPVDFSAAFDAIAKDGADALIVEPATLTVSHRSEIVVFAAARRLPAIYGTRDFVRAGGLMSYDASIEDVWRRVAFYVDKILKGTKPADLPIEQPAKFELIINLKTAKALGLTIPETLLAIADEVIQ
jgi:putative tryptophan/tyrosine transport system substrate-binding protein